MKTTEKFIIDYYSKQNIEIEPNEMEIDATEAYAKYYHAEQVKSSLADVSGNEVSLHPKGKPYGCPVCFEWYNGVKCEHCDNDR